MAKRTAKYGVLIALAFIFSYIEVLVPIPMPIPGIKLGLANLVVVIALYMMKTHDAAMISLVRILLVGITFGSMFSAFYSLAGGILSLMVMFVAKRSGWFSVLGVSLLGGIFHNMGQLLVAMVIVKNVKLFYLFGVLFLAGAVTGVLIGYLSWLLMERLGKIKKQDSGRL